MAEQLYDVLASKAVSGRQMPVLLLANKADCGSKAHSAEFIRKRLEKALDQLCSTRADVEAESGNVSRTPNVSAHPLLPAACADACSFADGSITSPTDVWLAHQVLKKAGDPFTFAGLAKARGAQVATASCSALQADLGELKDWLIRTIT